jgi:uncharacterized RDD family membrane protein YckC
MRCPKCHYISFGSVDRCRNCGYEFALAPDAKPIDLPIQSQDHAIGPLGDLQLGDRSASAGSSRVSASAPDGDAADRLSAGARAAGASRFDLPLFVDRDPLDDAPLISVPSAPRQPLSVRRAQPALPKPAAERTAGPSLLEPKRVDPEDARGKWVQEDEEARQAKDEGAEDKEAKNEHADIRRGETEPRAARKPVPRVSAPAMAAGHRDEREVASPLTRLAAGLIDVLVLAAIDGGVLFATLRVLGLTFAQAALLPPIPMIVFLVLLDGGYLTIFTVAGGQTIGKMIAGIRVIAQRPDDDPGFDAYTTRVTMGSAVLRASAYIVSLLPAGLGFAAILFDRDGRALHDRLAETRVVKA